MLAVCAGHVITAFVLVYAHTALWAWLRVKKGKIHQVQVAFAAEAGVLFIYSYIYICTKK